MADESKKAEAYVTMHPDIPRPEWKPPQKQPVPYSSEVEQRDPSTQSMGSNYMLMISAVVPRPIAFVSSRSASGSVNLAPFSYFNVMGHDPPVVCFSVCEAQGKHKDTLVNILESGECVVSIIAEWFIENANHTCGNWPYEMDEFEVSGLTKGESVKVKAPYVKESPFNMECKVINTYGVKNAAGKLSTTIITCEVVMMHIMKDVLDKDGNIDIEKYRPVSRLGGNCFANVREGWDVGRPAYHAPGDELLTRNQYNARNAAKK